MSVLHTLPFREVWAVDFEYISEDGERPAPVCMVAKELLSGRLLRLWHDDWPSSPPFAIGDDSLFVAYAAAAELSCFLVLGWPMPTRILDLHFEFVAKINGKGRPQKDGLLVALSMHGVPGITSDEKEAGRALVMRGGPWSAAERQEVLEYCQTDVDCLGPLLDRMLPAIRSRPKGLGQALLRGRYAAAVAHMEHVGVPIDMPLLERLRASWNTIKLGLVAEVDRDYGIYDGTAFRTDRFAAWLKREGIPWPRTETGALSLEQDTFHEMARAFPKVATLGDLRHAMGKLRLENLQVGEDGRNRAALMPFRSRTGRNQPSNAKFIFGPGKWMRGLIKPPQGKVLAYIDWSAQEVAIAAALSGDQTMIDDVQSGDPYLALAKMAGLAPEDATKQSHGAVRDQCKACVLGANYGMGYKTLAMRIGADACLARHLLKTMAERYPVYAKWAETTVDAGFMSGRLATVFGWPTRVSPNDRPTALQNFPMQSNAAEMMRIAACLATERGIRICCPVHDAFLVEVDEGTAGQEIAAARETMAQASRLVLGGLEIRTDVQQVCWPDRYSDERGAAMWARVMGLLENAEGRLVGREAGWSVGPYNNKEREDYSVSSLPTNQPTPPLGYRHDGSPRARSPQSITWPGR